MLAFLEKLPEPGYGCIELRMKPEVRRPCTTLASSLKLQLPTMRRITAIKALNPQRADFGQLRLQHYLNIGIASRAFEPHDERRQGMPGFLGVPE